MNRIALGILALIFALSLNMTYSQDKKVPGKDQKQPNLQIKPPVLTEPQVTKGTGKPVNTVCIVSGEEVDGKVLADYKGKTYSFCCKTCLKKFTKDPEKYVAKFEKSLKTKN